MLASLLNTELVGVKMVWCVGSIW